MVFYFSVQRFLGTSKEPKKDLQTFADDGKLARLPKQTSTHTFNCGFPFPAPCEMAKCQLGRNDQKIPFPTPLE